MNKWTMLFFLFISCVNNQEKKNDFLNKEAIPIGKLANGSFYEFIKLDSPYYKIRWGHKYLDTLTTDTTYELLGSGTMGYLTSNRQAIIFEQECGTNCNYIVVLPFNKTIKSQLIYECIAIDTIDNLVAYVSEDNKPFVYIKNFITNKKLEINENICNATTKIECISSCYFDKGFFYLKWFDSKYDNGKESHNQIKKYSINELKFE